MKKYKLTLLFSLTLTLTFAQLAKEITTLFEERANRPGGIVSVIENGKIEYQKSYGLANLDYDIPITTKTVFGDLPKLKLKSSSSILNHHDF